MFDYNYLKNIFIDNGGILKTSQLNGYGFSAYIINKLLLDGKIARVSSGHYMLSDTYLHDYEIISSLLPEDIVYLESALLLHEYTDRIPNEWQIAIGRNKDRNKYNLDYPKIKAYFIEENILEIEVMEIETYLNDMYKNTRIITKIYDKDKTICDIIRHRNKIDKEIFNNAIRKYINDKDKNLNNLYDYARKLNISGIVKTYIGVWF